MIRRLRGERGTAVVEFALIAPILLMLLLGIIQIGIYIFTMDDVRQATRAGGRLLVTLRNDPNAVSEVESKIAATVSSEVDPSSLSYSFSPAPPQSGWTGWAPGTAVTVTVTYPRTLSVMGIDISSSPITTTDNITVE